MDKYIQAMDLLKKYNQTHIAKLLEQTKDGQLVDEILSIDFQKIMKLYEDTKKENQILKKDIKPIEYINKERLDKQEKDKLEQIGVEIIGKGQYAVVTMAGGQGTRLGFNGPKGKYLIDILPQPKYLFEIVADKLKSANEKYNTQIFWYIMTSKENNKETVEFFEEKEYFGYSKNYVMFFEQSQMPLIDKQGKLLIDENKRIKQASDGNGQIFKSMYDNKVLGHMKKNNIEWTFIHSMDNILVNITDTILLGLTVSQNNLLGGKSVIKSSPYEKVGIYCKINEKIGVVEYTEVPQKLAEMVDTNNEYVYGQAHIMCSLFNIKLLEELGKIQLPYHTAIKVNSYMNETGEIIKPTEPNAYKFESFIFDGFQLTDKISLLQGKREEDFAPVKNATGTDSPETAIKLYNDYMRKEEN